MCKTVVILVTLSCLHAQALIYTSERSSTVEPSVRPDYRLPTSAKPKSYEVLLSLRLDENTTRDFTFDGSVVIELELEEAARSITLHSADLDFSRENCTLKRTDDGFVENFNVTFDEAKGFVHLTMLDDMVFADGAYLLRIDYSGRIMDYSKGYGVFKVPYENENNEKGWLVTTQFEPIYARYMLPCFDEPNYKATFDVTIINHKKYKALSNMPVKRKRHTQLKTITCFETTPPMATYLLAIVVFDFDNITNKHNNVSVYAPSNFVQYGGLALTTCEKMLRELEKYTNIKYELGKMDQVGLPISYIAMENWGLVVYSQEQILSDDKIHIIDDKQTTIKIVSHELAHQWFGNIVSPKWWTYLWLNEGLSSFFSYYIYEKIDPSWRSVDQFVINDVHGVLYEDSLAGKRPVCYNVETPNNTEEIFSMITYVKGAAIIRMLQHMITESNFQKGIQNYLNKTYHKSADSDDFYQAFQEVVDVANIRLPVRTIMDSWIKYEGYPILNVIRNYDSGTIIIKQERFYSHNNEQAEENIHKYYVPINYATSAKLDFEKTTPEHWLFNVSMEYKFNVDAEDWIILNKQQTSFYRVNYDDRNWGLIINYLTSANYTNIHILNRAQLLNDALALTQRDVLSVEILLRLTNYLKNEIDYIAWHPGLKAFSWLNERLINTEQYPLFVNYGLRTMKRLMNTVGFEDCDKDEPLNKLVRIAALNWICLLGDPSCLRKMHKKLVKWLDDPQENAISTDLKQVVLCNGLRTANYSTWEKVLQLKTSSPANSRESAMFNKALGCSSNKNILRIYIEFSMGPNLDLQDKLESTIDKIYQSRIGVDVVIELLVDKLSHDFIYHNRQLLGKILLGLSKKIMTTSQLHKLTTSEYMNLLPKKMTEVITQAEKNIEWLKKNKELVTRTINDILK